MFEYGKYLFFITTSNTKEEINVILSPRNINVFSYMPICHMHTITLTGALQKFMSMQRMVGFPAILYTVSKDSTSVTNSITILCYILVYLKQQYWNLRSFVTDFNRARLSPKRFPYSVFPAKL